jgi:outer membrane protein W
MRLHRALQAAGLTLAFAAPASPQPAIPSAPVVRADAAGTISWLTVNKADLDHYDDWYSTLYGGGSFGWYWTDHLKTEVEAGVSSTVDREVYRVERVDNRQIVRESTYRFATRRVTLAQHYQFYRNALFHPYVGAGVDLTWERIEQEDEPSLFFDSTGRSQVAQPGQVHAPRTDLLVRPFAAVGFKAYMSPRAFFRSDLKLVLRDGTDEVFLRMGIGVDF